MTESRAGQANDFADRLSKLFRPALGSAVRFGVTEIAEVEKFMIGPEPFDTTKRGYSRIPMRRRGETGARAFPRRIHRDRVALRRGRQAGPADGRAAFPLGGDRFRPSIEDFLRFIDTEGLFKDWADPETWRRVRAESLREWEYRQARATVRRHREAAIHELEDEGYVVIRPEAEPNAAQP